MKKFCLFMGAMVLSISSLVFAAGSDYSVNLPVFGTNTTMQKMLKFDPATNDGGYIHITVWDSVGSITPPYMTIHFVNGDTVQYYIPGQVTAPAIYEITTRMRFDSVHVVRIDTTTAVSGFISRVPRSNWR